ncbi:hypothetical protein GGS21DRAFT_297227 [Xylaria nigripes]|nr:hypothetical protein GGS21DRAFT_297227 [Xylaria nigripes]
MPRVFPSSLQARLDSRAGSHALFSFHQPISQSTKIKMNPIPPFSIPLGSISISISGRRAGGVPHFISFISFVLLFGSADAVLAWRWCVWYWGYGYGYGYGYSYIHVCMYVMYVLFFPPLPSIHFSMRCIMVGLPLIHEPSRAKLYPALYERAPFCLPACLSVCLSIYSVTKQPEPARKEKNPNKNSHLKVRSTEAVH